MGEAKRRTLHLPQQLNEDTADVFGPPPDPITSAHEALDTISDLRKRLGDAQAEIGELRRRATALKKGIVFNRTDFQHRLGQRLSGPDDVHGSLARIAITNSKDVLKSHGDEGAEELAVDVGRWLVSHVRSTDLVGRVGTSTFMIFFGFGDPKGVETKLRRLLSRIENAPVTFKETTLQPVLAFEIEEICTKTMIEGGDASDADGEDQENAKVNGAASGTASDLFIRSGAC